MLAERIRFTGALGDQLAARLERPDSEPRAMALFAHCFTCSKDLKSVRRISKSLVEEGIAVLSFDFTGLGESEGDFADTNTTGLKQLSTSDLVKHGWPLGGLRRAGVGQSVGVHGVVIASSVLINARATSVQGSSCCDC